MIKRLESLKIDNYNDRPIKSLLKGKGLLPLVGLAYIRPDRLTTCHSERKSHVSRRPNVYKEQEQKT
jgi:hypothetical protein